MPGYFICGQGGVPIGKPNKRETIRQLYERLLRSSEIPVIESGDIHSKGFCLIKGDNKSIYIKASLSLSEKLKVLLHEYSHYIHLSHHFSHENRAECELIANGSAYLIGKEFGLSIFKDVELDKYSSDADVVSRLKIAIQKVTGSILAGLK